MVEYSAYCTLMIPPGWDSSNCNYFEHVDILFSLKYVIIKSLQDLIKTLLDLCHKFTTVIMSYEQRSTGNKAEVERRFFQVRTCSQELSN